MLLSTVNELMCSGRDSSSCSTNDTRRVIVRRHEHHLNRYLLLFSDLKNDNDNENGSLNYFY